MSKRLSFDDVSRRCYIPSMIAKSMFPAVYQSPPGDVILRLRVIDMRGDTWHAVIQRDARCTYFMIIADHRNLPISHKKVVQRKWKMSRGDILMLSVSNCQGPIETGTFYVEWNSPRALANVNTRCGLSVLCTLEKCHRGPCRLLRHTTMGDNQGPSVDYHRMPSRSKTDPDEHDGSLEHMNEIPILEANESSQTKSPNEMH